jgi:hypothetical protein
MQIIDYNGIGFWSADAIVSRYETYARRSGIDPPRDIRPLVVEQKGKRWIYPVMDKVIEGIEAGDPACADIGVEFIEESASFTFGSILKSNTARALRRVPLNAEQVYRIRKRIVVMMCTDYMPREFRQYSRLGRKVGFESSLPEIEAKADLTKPWVKRYYDYLRQAP